MSETDDFYCDFVLSGKIAVERVRETGRVLAFHHTRPSYPLHIVIVPKEHIATLLIAEALFHNEGIFGMAQSMVRERRLHETNFRIITNGGSFQESKHLHVHLISNALPHRRSIELAMVKHRGAFILDHHFADEGSKKSMRTIQFD